MKTSSEYLVILGGTSAVAMAYARLAAKQGLNICLVGRNAAALKANAADLDARSSGEVKTHIADLGDTQTIARNWKSIVKKCGSVNHVLLAYGVLGDQEATQKDLFTLNQNLQTNFVSSCLWSEFAYTHFRQTGKGQLSVIGSVAGDRGRQSNYHYGAAKSGLEAFIEGMTHRAARTREADIGVLLVKPGFIDTPMTDHIDKGGPLWSTPEQIAQIIRRAEMRGKHKIYAPWFWRFILLIIRNVPHFVFKRTGL